MKRGSNVTKAEKAVDRRRPSGAGSRQTTIPGKPRTGSRAKRASAPTARPSRYADACVTVKLRTTLSESPEWLDQVLTKYSGEILVYDPDRDDVSCGSIGGTLVDVATCVFKGYDPFVVMDDESEALSQVGSSMFDDSTSPYDFLPWHPEVLQATSGSGIGPIGSKLLVIERLIVDAPFRGHHIGIRAMALFMRQLADGCAFMAIKPFPLQFEDGYRGERTGAKTGPFDEFTVNVKSATRKLHQHYAELGFVDLQGTDLMVLSTEYVHPYQSTTFGLADRNQSGD